MTTKHIFQLGTNNWQRQDEYAPGSGILHETHHMCYNSREHPDTQCWSVFPSKIQSAENETYRVFPLAHDIPICESISPVSSYRWHTMSDAEFDAYRTRLETFVYDFMAEIEADNGGAPFEFCVGVLSRSRRCCRCSAAAVTSTLCSLSSPPHTTPPPHLRCSSTVRSPPQLPQPDHYAQRNRSKSERREAGDAALLPGPRHCAQDVRSRALGAEAPRVSSALPRSPHRGGGI